MSKRPNHEMDWGSARNDIAIARSWHGVTMRFLGQGAVVLLVCLFAFDTITTRLLAQEAVRQNAPALQANPNTANQVPANPLRATNPLRSASTTGSKGGTRVDTRLVSQDLPVEQSTSSLSQSTQLAAPRILHSGDDLVSVQEPREQGGRDPETRGQTPTWEEIDVGSRSVLDGTDSLPAPADERLLVEGPDSIGAMLPAPTPKSITINPLAVPQGVASWAFSDHQPLNGERLGFPFSIFPDNLYHRIPRIKVAWDTPSGRSIGRGEPLQTTSWRNRPLHVDFFNGGYFAGSPIDGVGDPAGANFIGGRVGWDLNHFFGTELRIGYARANLDDIQNSMDIRVTDLHLHYYPWGDARVRPYTKIGLGLTYIELVDSAGLGRSATAASLPIGIGVKYYVKHWLTLRAEFEDNITFGSGSFSTTNNLSITGGFEFRFGGRRPTYYPFTSSRMSFF